MLAVLALSLALAAPRCLQVEIVAMGRSAHGSAIMPQAAPHLLIKALDRLPGWVESSSAIAEARITSLKAAPAINLIPRRAAAVLDVTFDDAIIDSEAWITDLAQAVGPGVEVEALTTPCRPQSRPESPPKS